MTGKYHKAIGFPPVQIPSGTYFLQYTAHALTASDDRYGQIPKFNRITFSADDVFEIVLTNGQITKFAIRLPYRDNLDLTLVISGCRVVTQWLNSRDDQHDTLDFSKYATV